MIPDKIYVREYSEGVSQMWSNVLATETTATAQHEYIRKDALLDWAKEMKEYKENQNDSYYDSAITVLEMLIDKLQSL